VPYLNAVAVTALPLLLTVPLSVALVLAVAVAELVLTDGAAEQVLERGVPETPATTGVTVILGQPMAAAIYAKVTVSVLLPLFPGANVEVVMLLAVVTLAQFQLLPRTAQFA
jgi:hypothetical protein